MSKLHYLNDLMKCIEYAAFYHRNQFKKDFPDYPYINHIIKVVRLLTECGIKKKKTLQAAVLHDIIEDTSVNEEMIKASFGSKVAKIVTELTDDMRLSKENRKINQLNNAPNLSPEAKIIRLADKTCNIKDFLDYRIKLSPEKCIEFVDFLEQIFDKIKGENQKLDKLFIDTLKSFKHFQASL